jgi:phage gp36-like protein
MLSQPFVLLFKGCCKVGFYYLQSRKLDDSDRANNLFAAAFAGLDLVSFMISYGLISYAC